MGHRDLALNPNWAMFDDGSRWPFVEFVMPKVAPSLNVRMPPEMRAWLEARAADNERTLNKEVVLLLKKAMQADPALPKPATDKAA